MLSRSISNTSIFLINSTAGRRRTTGGTTGGTTGAAAEYRDSVTNTSHNPSQSNMDYIQVASDNSINSYDLISFGPEELAGVIMSKSMLQDAVSLRAYRLVAQVNHQQGRVQTQPNLSLDPQQQSEGRSRSRVFETTTTTPSRILKLTAREKDSSRSDGVSEHLQLKRNVRFEDEETFNTQERKRRKTFYQECMVATTFTSAAPGDLTVKKTQKSSPFYSKGLMHINDIKIKMSNVLFDTGASNSSYISEEFVIKHRQQMEPFIFPHRSLVTLGDGLTKCAITECLIVPCSFADERGKEHKGIVKFSIFKTSGEFIIIGVPDICTSFRILVIQMILGYEDDHVESEAEKLGKTFKQNSLIDRVPIDVDAGFKYYIDVDAENAFHQVDLSEAKSNKLSIITPCELYRPLSMPEGISSAKYKASFEKKEDAPSNSCTLHLPDCNNSSVCLAQTEESTFTNL